MSITGDKALAGRRRMLARCWRRAGNRAFTLVEIVVVLLIVAVFTTMTVLALSSSTGGAAARESAARLLFTLRYARGYAIIHACQCRLTLRQDGSYELGVRTDPARDRFEPVPGGHRDRLERYVHFATLVIGSRSDEQDNADILTFESTGQCDGAVIEVTDGRAVYTLTVSPHSGLVQIHPGPAGDIPSDREDLDG